MANFFMDSLRSLQTRLGGPQDKGRGAEYLFVPYTDQQIEMAYRSSWIMRKAIDIPVDDATRKWRKFTDEDGKTMDEVTKLEKRLAVQSKVKSAKINARLFGGAALLIGVRGQEDFEIPLDPDRVGPGDLRFLTKLERYNLIELAPVTDPRSPRYGRSIYYQVTTGSGEFLRVHYSHLVEFDGEEKPTGTTISDLNVSQRGDSLLQVLMEPLRNVDNVMANMATLVADAKTDVIKIPGLSQNITNPAYEEGLMTRFGAARMVKGNHGVLILDKEEEYQSVIYGLDGLPPAAQQFMQVAAAAADIPMTRFMSQSPGGMNATGDSDLNNYHDALSAMQENELTPALESFDRVLIRSAGYDPARVISAWEPLKQVSTAEAADLQSKVAAMVAALAGTQIFSDTQIEAVAIEAMGKAGLKGLETDQASEVTGTTKGDEDGGF